MDKMYYILASIGGLLLGFAIYKLTGIQIIKRWLLWAVMEAEKALGSGTGKAKLMMVYDLFIQKFSFVAKFISFNTFSSWVDIALEEMKQVLQNKAIARYLSGDDMIT